MLALLSVTYLLEQGTRQIYNATLPQIRLDFLQYCVTDAQLYDRDLRVHQIHLMMCGAKGETI